MSRRDVSIPTPQGDARSFVFTPDNGPGPWPAVLMFMDAIAIRPALFELGERLASHGYYVLLPDMFWRLGDYPPMDIEAAFSSHETRMAMLRPMMASTDPERAMADTAAFLDWLSAQPQVKGAKVGATGYCMGGTMAIRAAASFPDRVVVAASFHAGGLATDADNSPHRLAPRIKAKVLVAGADQDAGFDAAQKARLEQAFAEAGTDAEVSIYPGALHGYTMPDLPVFHEQGSERHWRELVALLDATLKG